jgi:hypothetical protein
LPNPWGWVENAKLVEHQTFRGKAVDVWAFNVCPQKIHKNLKNYKKKGTKKSITRSPGKLSKLY